MSLIQYNKVDNMLEQIISNILSTQVSAAEGSTDKELAAMVIKQQVKYFLSWYNNQLIEEIEKMKHNPAKDTHEIGMNQGFTDMICKLKDQSLSDKK